MKFNDLSTEQKQFVKHAYDGRSVLVDACIGSGKTTAIQVLCNVLGKKKSVLYLTYNKLLKLDAKARIKYPGITVTNYHGFAYQELRRNHLQCSFQECVPAYCRANLQTPHYDVLILDEYQDIDQDIAAMLEHIKRVNPGLQIIAVGDMAQKIYDSTKLDAAQFIDEFLPIGYQRMEFTQCFRLGPSHASMLGKIWGKTIVGVNDDFSVVESMTFNKVFAYLKELNPGDILCLGSNNGKRSEMLNKLEETCPEKFNKYTVWSKITEQDGGATEPGPGVAIFTTYDSCKGMERDVCVVFDWDETYWGIRRDMPNVRYEILRNIFCAAASRGKRKIIFVDTKTPLSPKTLMDDFTGAQNYRDVSISAMFDFKYDEDIEAAYKTLATTDISEAQVPIDVPTSDGLIDLSPCIGIYQEAAFFSGYDIDRAIKMFFDVNKDRYDKFSNVRKNWTVEQKVLYLTSLETSQNRYWQQVKTPFVTPEQWGQISARLKSRLSCHANVQAECHIPFMKNGEELFEAKGFCDVLEDDCVIELKFVDELAHKHFLQCASYMVALNKPRGLLWNVRTNQIFEITIPDMEKFMDRVARAVTKGHLLCWGHTDTKSIPAVKSTCGYRTNGATAAKVFAFCLQNAAISNAIVAKVIDMENKGQKCTPTKLKNLYQSKGIDLPTTQKTFSKYFREYIDYVLTD